MISIGLLMVGIAGTWIGAELLVRGSARLALGLGIRPLVVGLTVVALGTSSPEAVVSFVAAARSAGGLALGNVLGSNIANVGLILGLVALLHPVRIRWRELRLDLFLMLAATALVCVFILSESLGPLAGVLFLLFFVLVMLHYVREGGRSPVEREGLPARVSGRRGLILAGLQSLLGLAILVVGAHLLVLGATRIARVLGIPEAVIGATLVAVGTSLPELAASAVAVWRGHHEIGIGNIIGSNMMNLLFVLGGVCLIGNVQVDEQLRTVVLPVMVLFSIALIPILARGERIGRRTGGLLLGSYLIFSGLVYFL